MASAVAAGDMPGAGFSSSLFIKDKVFPDLQANFTNLIRFCERVILVPENFTVIKTCYDPCYASFQVGWGLLSLWMPF